MTNPAIDLSISSLIAELPQCMLRDRQPLRRRLQRVQQMLRDGRPLGGLLAQIEADLRASHSQRHDRQLHRPLPVYPPDLPVVQKRQEIAAAIAAHPVVILCGETGSGKTTQLPKICLDLGRGMDGMIGHTQPRRIAARSVAARVADELHVPLGHAVGYKVRFGDRTRPDTYIKLMTDGILLAETQSDRLLEAYDTIIVDEAHERSLNIDFLLGYLKQLLPRRPDLKIIITSATIDPQRFSRHFGDAPIIEVSGRTYPVEVRYRPLKSDDPEEEDREQVQGIVEAVDELSRCGPGDVLVFLPGEREIREAAEELRKHHPPATEILPLFARLSADEQSRIFQPHNKRRIVLTTNVAETSLTVPGIRYVVDSGLARISRYSARSKVQRLPIEPISRASADQRTGRCGRVSEGVCIRLYAESDYLARPAFTEPEILRTNLAAVILQMMALRLGEVNRFPFVEPPDARLIRDGYLTLHELGAVDEENRLTEVGRHLARLPIDPRLGRMLLAADHEHCLAEVLIIAAALSVQDPRERPVELQSVADDAHKQFTDQTSDFLSYLKMWDFFREKSRHLSNNQLRKQCKNQFLSYVRLREWAEVHRQLKEQMTEMGFALNTRPAHPDNIHRALLTGLLSNVGTRTEKAEYAGPRGSKFYLFPGSALFSAKPAWVMAAELVETTRLYARTVAKVMPQWIERAADHLVKRTYTDPTWDRARADVVAGERVALRGLVLVPHRTVSYGPIDPRTAREVFIHHALVEGEFRTAGEFFKHNQSLLAQVQSLQAKGRRHDLLAPPQQRFAFYNTRVPADVFNGRLFEQWRKSAERDDPQLLFMSLADVALPQAAEVDIAHYPDSLCVGPITLPLSYVYEYGNPADGITAAIPLSLLNQVPSAPFDWLVAGFLPEKIVELIRTLPKPIRTKLVPAPDFAAQAAAALEAADRAAPFLDVIAHQLGRLIGQTIPKQDFRPEALPAYLKMNFRIIDDAGKTVATGRDLPALRHQLGSAARESFAALPPPDFTRDGITRWDFDDLPERVEVRRNGTAYSGFPALLDRSDSVSLRLLDSREASRLATRAGVRRLFMLQLEPELRQLRRGSLITDQMVLQYKPLGSGAELKDQLLSAAVDQALFGDDTTSDIRTREQFVAAAQDGWRRLSAASRRLATLAAEALEQYHALALQLSNDYPPLLQPSIQDLRQQLANMMPKDFLTATPPQWLPQLPRYLRGMVIRLRKLTNAGLPRDQQLMHEIRPLWQQYLDRRNALLARGIHDPQLANVCWMIEELRVSLFAQELKTAVPVSVQRVQRQLESLAMSGSGVS